MPISRLLHPESYFKSHALTSNGLTRGGADNILNLDFMSKGRGIDLCSNDQSVDCKGVAQKQHP